MNRELKYEFEDVYEHKEEKLPKLIARFQIPFEGLKTPFHKNPDDTGRKNEMKILLL